MDIVVRTTGEPFPVTIDRCDDGRLLVTLDPDVPARQLAGRLAADLEHNGLHPGCPDADLAALVHSAMRDWAGLPGSPDWWARLAPYEVPGPVRR